MARVECDDNARSSPPRRTSRSPRSGTHVEEFSAKSCRHLSRMMTWREHHAEFAGNENMMDQADAKAEAKALASAKSRTEIHCFVFLNVTCAESRAADEDATLLLRREPRVFLLV
jgi:hypothetical protein